MFGRRLARVAADRRPAVEVLDQRHIGRDGVDRAWTAGGVARRSPVRVGSSPRSMVRISFGSVSTGPIWRIHKRTRIRIASTASRMPSPPRPTMTVGSVSGRVGVPGATFGGGGTYGREA